MQVSPPLLLHISAGTVGLLSGTVSMSFRKGSRGHRAAGNVFFVSMLCVAAMGTYMAIVKAQPTNVGGGLLTFYLVTTAWVTARRRQPGTGVFDWIALPFPLTVGTGMWTYGFEAANSPTGSIAGVPAPMYFLLGTVAFIAAAGDIRMIVRGGISGTQRLARHLWRMCFGLFIASASIFIARPRLFPAILSSTNVLLILGILPLILMIFWLYRVRFTNASRALQLTPVLLHR